MVSKQETICWKLLLKISVSLIYTMPACLLEELSSMPIHIQNDLNQQRTKVMKLNKRKENSSVMQRCQHLFSSIETMNLLSRAGKNFAQVQDVMKDKRNQKLITVLIRRPDYECYCIAAYVVLYCSIVYCTWYETGKKVL
ncbi:hypothetical protein LINGRAHAP2_LOCUS28857 [Linum grandiflorum]